jgi:hypothetical protein
MIWAAIRDCATGGTRIAPKGGPGWDWSFRAASILCEIDLSRRRARTGPVLLARGPGDAGGGLRQQGFALSILDGHMLHLAHRRGKAVLELALSLSEEDTWGRLRISYVRLPTGRAWLTAEMPDIGRVRQREAAASPVLDPGLVCDLVAGAGGTSVAPDWVAAGSGRYRLGLGAAVAAGTRIDTPDGPRPVEALAAGDRVLAPDGTALPLSGVVRVDAPALGGFRPVRLSAPYLGLTADMAVHPNARVLLTGMDVEYLTGEAGVLVEARHLAHARAAVPAAEAPCIAWHGLVLPGAAVVAAHGVAVAAAGADMVPRLGRIAATTALAAHAGPPVRGGPRLPPCPRLLRGAEAQAVVMTLDRRHAPFAA